MLEIIKKKLLFFSFFIQIGYICFSCESMDHTSELALVRSLLREASFSAGQSNSCGSHTIQKDRSPSSLLITSLSSGKSPNLKKTLLQKSRPQLTIKRIIHKRRTKQKLKLTIARILWQNPNHRLQLLKSRFGIGS